MCFLFLAKCKGASPLKILNIGNVSTPLMCLSESVNLTEKNIMWGGCGTKVLYFMKSKLVKFEVPLTNTKMILQRN